jgi:hypothetical protein
MVCTATGSELSGRFQERLPSGTQVSFVFDLEQYHGPDLYRGVVFAVLLLESGTYVNTWSNRTATIEVQSGLSGVSIRSLTLDPSPGTSTPDQSISIAGTARCTSR